MGIRSTIYSKFKGFEDIAEDLNQAGLAQKELEGYNDLYEEYETSVHDLSKVSKKESKAEERLWNENKKIEKIQKEMKKLREKAGPLARLRFSRIFFWSKQGKLYRNLKRRLERAEVRQTLAEHELREYQAKAKGIEKTVEQKRKSLKEEQKTIRKIWNQNQDEIKFMKNYSSNKEKVEKIYSDEKQEEMEKAVDELQQEGDLPQNVEAKDLDKEIKTAVKNEKEPQVSILDKEGNAKEYFEYSVKVECIKFRSEKKVDRDLSDIDINPVYYDQQQIVNKEKEDEREIE